MDMFVSTTITVWWARASEMLDFWEDSLQRSCHNVCGTSSTTLRGLD
jgi:hypothetical protein